MSKTAKKPPNTTNGLPSKKSNESEPQTISHEIFVDDEGNLQFLYDDELADLLDCGEPERTRASHVEPFGTSQWTADMSPVGGPLLGPFPTRTMALSEEKDWLNNFLSQ